MTRRERLEAKVERRHEWAEKAEKRSEAGFNAARRIADGIPFGQPILVGHHSEKHHRADIGRIDSGMRRGVENAELAEHHESRAAGLEHQLERSIFSDDPNAIEQLEAKAAELEAECERMVKVNKLYRKGDAAGLSALGLDLEKLRERMKGASSWETAPYPAYSLSNRRAVARNARKRIEDVKRRQVRAQTAEEAGGVTIERSATWCRVTFAEKPEREILNALREAGYSWGGGSWAGHLDRLPARVATRGDDAL